MARYIGPKSKISRKFSEPLFGFDKVLEKKKYPPGMHGFGARRGKKSEYAIQLSEKQKVKYIYGILEKQFRNLFKEASRRGGITGEILLQLCESRLDNIVYRLGLSPTRAGSRQLVSHNHIIVNGKVVNIPSYQIQVDDVVGVRNKSKSLESINNSLAKAEIKRYDWLDWNPQELSGKFINAPEREVIPENIKEQLIVELYSK